MKSKVVGILILPLLLALSMVFLVKGLSAYTADAYREAEKISEVREIVLYYYVDKVKSEKLLKGALQGMLSVLDPYSEYLDEEEYRYLTEGTKGEFTGIGVEITLEKGVLTIVSLLEDSPAAKAGALAGDIVLSIEVEKSGKKKWLPTEGLALNNIVSYLRGKKGTMVRIQVLHEDKTKEILTIIRDVIKISSIKDSRILDKKLGIGYLRLTKFNDHTAEGLRKNIEKLRKQGMRSLVIDLRFNPGGVLKAAVDVVDCFIADGVIVYTKGRTSDSHHVYRAGSKNTYTKMPLVLLVNDKSASASEIVTGALQDYHRAVIVGTNTYGKGSVQSIIRLKDEKTALKLTTAKYYTPCGRSITKSEKSSGLKPDVFIKLTKKEQRELYYSWVTKTKKFQDKQLQKAIFVLKGKKILHYFGKKTSKN